MSNNDNISELTAEKSLFAVFKKSRRLGRSKFNTITTIIVFFVFVWVSFLYGLSIKRLVSIVNDLASIALTFSSSLLGFAITGFAILITMTPSRLFVSALDVIEEKSNLPYIQVFFLSFVEVFIYFVALIFVGFLGKALIGPECLLDANLAESCFVVSLLIKIYYVLIVTLFYYVIVQIKSFVFNIYHLTISYYADKVAQRKDINRRLRLKTK